MVPNKRERVGLEFAENETREVKLSKGFLEEGLVLTGDYVATVATDATSVRAYSCPIKTISLIGDGGKALHIVKPADLIAEQLIYEQSPLASMLSVPSGVTALGGPYAGSFNIPLPFKEPFAKRGDVTDLPTWMYDELTLRVEWGSHDELFVGGTGSVAMATAPVVIQSGVEDDFSALGDPFVWGAQLLRSLRGYKSVAVAAAVDTEYTIELPRTADYRSIIIATLDANGEPVGTIVNKVTLLVNNNNRQLSNIPQSSLRADNARIFGAVMPTGYQVIEFAEDQDIIPPNILPARQFTALDLVLSKAAVAGTIRVFYKRLETFSN